MKKLYMLLVFAVSLCLFGCGGESGDSIDFGEKGLGFSAENPNIARAGQTLDLLVFTRAWSSGENNTEVTTQVTATGATPTEASFTSMLGRVGEIKYRVIHLNVAAGTPAGSPIRVTIARDVPNGANSHQEESFSLTVGASTLEASFAPVSVTGAPGTDVTSTLSIIPFGSAAGSGTIVSPLAGTSIAPNAFTVSTAQGPATAIVRYRVPAGAAVGSVIEVPVFFQSVAGHGFAVLRVTVGAVAMPDFTFSILPTSLNIHGGDSAPVTMTITPEAGFRGNVTIQAAFPHASLSFTPPTTNPIVVNITSDAPVSTTFSIRWNSQQGISQGPVVLTATGGGHTHTANLGLVAS